MSSPQEVVDVVTIGGGPAGLAAALCLGRARRSVLVVDSDHPRHAVAEGVHNFLTREGIPPAALRRVAWEQMHTYPTVTRYAGNAIGLDRRDEHWFVERDDGRTVAARAVLLATGVVDQHPDIRGYDALWGRSIFHCPYCHGWEVRDQALAVVGQPPNVMQFAPLLLSWSSDIVVCTNGQPLDAGLATELAERGIGVRTSRITELVAANDALREIRFDDASTLQRDALFVMPSPRLPDLVASLGLEVDDQGFVRIDGDGATSAKSLWAAGDLTSKRHQVIEAAAQGLRAAAAINRALAFDRVAVV
jgi:thioredoxin reductase